MAAGGRKQAAPAKEEDKDLEGWGGRGGGRIGVEGREEEKEEKWEEDKEMEIEERRS